MVNTPSTSPPIHSSNKEKLMGKLGKEMYHEECFRCQECHTTISGTVYASTSKGVYCVNCHNERMARSRKHHEDRKRRAKERQERKSQRDRLSPNLNVDRDKSLPAPPPEPSPNLSVQSLSPVLWSPRHALLICSRRYLRRSSRHIYWPVGQTELQRINFAQRDFLSHATCQP